MGLTGSQVNLIVASDPVHYIAGRCVSSAHPIPTSRNHIGGCSIDSDRVVVPCAAIITPGARDNNLAVILDRHGQSRLLNGTPLAGRPVRRAICVAITSAAAGPRVSGPVQHHAVGLVRGPEIITHSNVARGRVTEHQHPVSKGTARSNSVVIYINIPVRLYRHPVIALIPIPCSNEPVRGTIAAAGGIARVPRSTAPASAIQTLEIVGICNTIYLIAKLIPLPFQLSLKRQTVHHIIHVP